MFNLTLNNITKSFNKTIKDLDAFVRLCEMKEESANSRITQANEDLEEASQERDVASRIKDNLTKLIAGA